MKVITSVSIMACGLILCGITEAAAQSKISLSGQITNPTAAKVYIKKFAGGGYQTVDSTTLNAQGRFAMNFAWGAAGKANFFHGEEQTPLYLSPGDKLTLTLDAKQFDETVKYSGKGAVVNNYLAQEVLHKDTGAEQRARIFFQAEPVYVRFSDSVLAADEQFLTSYFSKQKLTKAEAAFVEQIKTDMQYAWARERMNYPGMHSYYNKLEKPYEPTPAYFDFLKKVKIDNPDAVNSNSYLFFVNAYVSAEASKKHKKFAEGSAPNFTGLKFEVINEQFTPGPVKATLVREALDSGLRNKQDFDAVEPLMPKLRAEAAPWPKQLAEIDKVYASRQKLKAGSPAPDFSAKTPEGKTVSLSDFTGKVVYVDIWASWCGPCIMQIPFAKKLMAEFEGKEVVFLNISIDQSEDAWKASLAKYGIHGVNALADGAFSSAIAKEYQVKGIPQYLLIGKDGNIISGYADRPSGKAKEQIEAALAASATSGNR